MSDHPEIGFPPPLLGDAPQRLPVVYDDGSLFALNKPQDVLILSDNWFPRIPVLTEAVNYQAAQQKPELVRLGIGEGGLQAVYPLDPDITGVALFARDPETGMRLRNEYGSGVLEFEFELVAERAPADGVAFCQLPLARHFDMPRMVVSSRTGKKSETRFERTGEAGRYTIWRAVSSYPRMHQIRLHAFECGIHVMGDTLYAFSRVPMISDLKRNFRPGRRSESTLYDGPAIHLKSVSLPGERGEDPLRISAPRSRRFSVLIKQLERLSS